MATQTINISLPRELVTQVDGLAKERFTSRSDVIREVLADRLALRSQLDRMYSSARKSGKKAGIKTSKDVERVIREVRQER